MQAYAKANVVVDKLSQNTLNTLKSLKVPDAKAVHLGNTKLDVQPSADAFETRANVMKAMQGHILGKAVYGGLFKWPS